MKKKDWKWMAFGVFSGIAINILASSMNLDMIKGLVLGLIFGAIGGIFVADRFFKDQKEELTNEENTIEDETEEGDEEETEDKEEEKA